MARKVEARDIKNNSMKRKRRLMMANDKEHRAH
jgi:hypothetical protein